MRKSTGRLLVCLKRMGLDGNIWLQRAKERMGRGKGGCGYSMEVREKHLNVGWDVLRSSQEQLLCWV